MLLMCVMDIMNVLRTGMNMFISRIHVWQCYIRSGSIIKDFQKEIVFLYLIVLMRYTCTGDGSVKVNKLDKLKLHE